MVTCEERRAFGKAQCRLIYEVRHAKTKGHKFSYVPRKKWDVAASLEKQGVMRITFFDRESMVVEVLS